jgi:hypothetical protein
MLAVCAEMLNLVIGALTPVQRFHAMRQLKTNVDTSFLTNKWFILLGWSLMAVLGILLIAIRRMRMEKERQATQDRFLDLTNRCQLNPQERDMLEAICSRSGLRKKDAIFIEPTSFDDGLAKLMQDSFAAGHNLAQRKRLNQMAYGIKNKLGFQKSISEFGVSGESSRNLSSRQIPIGKTVLVTQDKAASGKFKAEVIGNSPYELTLLPKVPLEILPGCKVMVQYRIGEIIWEYSSMIISCGPQGLELIHTDNVRFLNRRRFQRAVVQKKARIAKFAVIRSLPSPEAPLPEWVDATVTEIAGPGLRVQTELDVKLRDRVVVVFELEAGRWIQDIAEVRGLRSDQEMPSVVVELVGLSEQAVNDLIRVTNALASDSSQPDNEDWVNTEATNAEQMV